MNPFNLAGPHFLQIYLVVLAMAVITAFVARWWMRQPSEEPNIAALDLQPYEIAYLSGGERRAIDAAIICLVKSGALRIDAVTRRFTQLSETLTGKIHPLEKAVFEACNVEPGMLADSVRERVSATANKLRGRLVELGLLVPSRQASLVQLAPACAILAAALFGLIKIFIGLARHRPVGFLVLLLILTVAIAAAFFFTRPLRSRRGDRAMQLLKREGAALAYSAGPRVNDLAESDLTMAIALFGMGVLAGGPLARLPNLLVPQPSSSQSTGSGSSSSCGSSCGGGGGGCGGGCGGGGCGGCGG